MIFKRIKPEKENYLGMVYDLKKKKIVETILAFQNHYPILFNFFWEKIHYFKKYVFLIVKIF